MPVSDVLNKFRNKGYGKDEPSGDDEKSPEGARTIKLTDDEAKEIQGGSQGDGAEQTCQVTGRLNGSEFTVTSVHSGGGMPDEKNMAAQVAGQPPMPMTMPSPS